MVSDLFVLKNIVSVKGKTYLTTVSCKAAAAVLSWVSDYFNNDHVRSKRLLFHFTTAVYGHARCEGKMKKKR